MPVIEAESLTIFRYSVKDLAILVAETSCRLGFGGVSILENGSVQETFLQKAPGRSSRNFRARLRVRFLLLDRFYGGGAL